MIYIKHQYKLLHADLGLHSTLIFLTCNNGLSNKKGKVHNYIYRNMDIIS